MTCSIEIEDIGLMTAGGRGPKQWWCSITDGSVIVLGNGGKTVARIYMTPLSQQGIDGELVSGVWVENEPVKKKAMTGSERAKAYRERKKLEGAK